MPLLDHFHAPLEEDDFWVSLHTLWVAAIVERLNAGGLPEGYRARAHVHVGEVAVDVGAFPRGDPPPAEPSPAGDAAGWAPAAAALVIPAAFPDELEVRIYSTRSGWRLVAAIELVSLRNKDRPDARRAFAAKCAAYLAHGAGLILVDIVTSRSANLHDELMHLLGHQNGALFPPDSLYAVAYRPSDPERAEGRIEVWAERLAVGAPLPVLPLALRDDGCVRVDLEATYMLACERSAL